MAGPLYIPVLQTRPHAVGAYSRLWPEAQNALTPVWNLPPRPGLPPAELTAEVRKDVVAVSAGESYSPWWSSSAASFRLRFWSVRRAVM